MSTDPSKDLHKALEELKAQAGVKKPEPIKDLHKEIEQLKSDATDLQAKIAGSGKRRVHVTTTKQPVKVEPIQDLTRQIEEMKVDVTQLQNSISTTELQTHDIRQISKEIEKAHQLIISGKVNQSQINETIAKIKKVKEEIEETLEKKEIQPELIKPPYVFPLLVQYLYDKSNYPTQAELDKALKEKGMAAMQDFKPKTVGDALTRLAYGMCETVLGGFTDATLGIAYDPKSKDRRYALPLQVAGAIMTPSALDYAFGAVLTKLGVTKAGRKIIKKLNNLVDSGDDVVAGLSKDELRQVEKIIGNSGISTADLRKIDKKTLRTIQEVADYYAKHPAEFTAGAAYVPPEQLFYEEIIDDLGWDDDLYIDFLKTYGDRLNLDKNWLAGVLLRASLDDAVKVLDSTAVEIPSDYKDRLIRFPPQEKLKTTPETGTGEEEVTEQEPEQIPIQIPEQKPKQTPKQTPEQIPEQIHEPPPILSEEPLPTEEPVPPEESTLPFLPESKPEERRDIRLRLWGGPKEKYRVKFSYPMGQSQTVTVEARSFPEAVNKAQRSRRGNRYLPSVVDITKVKG